MNDDDLRAGLGRLDPSPAARPVDSASSPRAHSILESVMAAPLDTIHDTESSSVSRDPQGRRGRWAVLAAAAGVAAIIGTAAVVTSGDDPVARPAAPQQQAMMLTAPDGLTMQSCIPFDVKFLADAPVAFGGTVTAVTGGSATLDVDRWFASDAGRPDQVQVSTGDGASVALDGVEFVVGQRFLVTATGGTVRTCGFSGPATTDLESSFEQAFPG